MSVRERKKKRTGEKERQRLIERLRREETIVREVKASSDIGR